MDTHNKVRTYLISRKADGFFQKIYKSTSFAARYFKELLTSPHEVGEFIQQCYNIGYRSLSLISLTSFITGFVFTKQSRPSLSEFGATSWLPSLVGIAMIRALAPLVTALICAGKVGSSIGAEIGSMKVTEQIDAMEVSAVNPYKYLVVTRVTASTLMVPVLMMYSGCVGLLGAYANVSQNELTSFIAFFQNAFEKITMLDIVSALILSLIHI